MLVNTDSTIERVNPATTELTGFSDGELIGQSLSILTVNNRSFQNILTRLIQRERSGGRLETVCVRKDVSALPAVVSVSKIRGAVDGQSKVVLVAKGIGRRKRLEIESLLITRILRGVTSTANLDELLQLIHSLIKKIYCTLKISLSLCVTRTPSC